MQTLHQTLHLRCWVQGLGAQGAGEELSSTLGVLARVILDYIDIIRGGLHRARKRKVHSTFFGCTLRINSARYKGLAVGWGLGLTFWSFQ